MIGLLTYLWPSLVINRCNLGEERLKSLGFVTDGHGNITDPQPFWVFWRLAFIVLAFLTVTLLSAVIFLVVILKKVIGRHRPSNLLFLKRHLDMRSREPGKSMPSGDTLAAAYFCIFYIFIFKAPIWICVCIPLVALGRVYTHCHWIGDTLVGGLLGVGSTILMVNSELPALFVSNSLYIFKLH